MFDLLHTDKSFDGAIKIAHHHHLTSIAEKMNKLKEVICEDRRTLKSILFKKIDCVGEIAGTADGGFESG